MILVMLHIVYPLFFALTLVCLGRGIFYGTGCNYVPLGNANRYPSGKSLLNLLF